MTKLSAVISAYNGEKTIRQCLDSVKDVVSEIIVIDNSSSDKTNDIAKKYTQKVFKQQNNPLAIDLLKNSGFEKATSEWILCLDQDEILTKELREEIKAVLKKEKQNIEGFWIPRKNYIFGKWIKQAGWYPDYQLRLFRKGKGKYEEEHVHQQIKIKGETEYLKNHIIHNNYQSIDQFIQKTTVYAKNEAKNKLKEGYSFSYLDAVRFPVEEFFSRFFAREGYKDGFHGLMVSVFMAFYHFIVFANLWEKQGFTEANDEKFFANIDKEFIKTGKHLKHWLFEVKIKESKNLIKKTYLKLKRKIK